MAIYGIVTDAAGVQLGAGFVRVVECTITRELDGAGSFRATLALTDERNLELIRNERRLRFLVEMRDGSAQDIGGGIITSVEQTEDANSSVLQVEGIDALHELARRSCLINRAFDDAPIGDVLQTLVGLVSGWRVLYNGGGTATLKLDGASVLKALVTLAEQTGLHFRLGVGREVEFGVFGEASRARALRLPGNSPRVGQLPEIMPISSVKLLYTSRELVNWILPLGGGTGSSILTLQNAVGGGRYDIQTLTLPDATTGYFLSDAASISQYGEIQRVVKFDIQPVGNPPTTAQIAAAAQQLYQAASEELARLSKIQTVYELKCKRALIPVQVGERLRVTYRGIAERAGGRFEYLNIDEALYVLSVTESYGVNSDDVTLEVSNVDVRPRNGVMKLASTVETVEVASIRGF